MEIMDEMLPSSVFGLPTPNKKILNQKEIHKYEKYTYSF